VPRSDEIESRRLHPALIFTLAFLAVFALHIPLLRLPYFWDEAGYYVPAARDLMLSGSPIPHSTPSNAHPPLVMAYLALCWRIAGYAPVVTRTAMLLISAFSLSGVFRLARRVANPEVAVAATICTALYPVFFAQSSLAHLDLAAAGLTFWALGSYVEQRPGETALWFSLAVLAKETAVLAPLALFAWELLCPALRGSARKSRCLVPQWSWKSGLLLVPLLPLGLWYGYHYWHTGFVFGNPEFFRYNVQEPLHPLRVLLAFLLRLWQTLGYLGLYLLAAATLFAMWRAPVHDVDGERRRIALGVQFAFLAVIAIYVIFMALVGGAVLARYMLPVVPLVIIIGVSTLRRRVPAWRWVVAIVALGFIVGLFVNPPYGFSPEDNLAYRDYIVLHQRAEDFVEARYPMARVLTAWPASDELSRPYLGYVTRPMRVVRIEHFAVEPLMAATDLRSQFDVALVFSTKYQAPHSRLEDWPTWVEWKTRFFGYHRDVPPAAAAQLLGGQLVYTESRHGQWVGVIEMERVMEARASAPQ
jgi:4-amino-4-deoxy-L-arabinose transferase-like glycosyltransferase